MSVIVVDVQMAVEGRERRAAQFDAQVDWFTIDTDAYCSVLGNEPSAAADNEHYS